MDRVCDNDMHIRHYRRGTSYGIKEGRGVAFQTGFWLPIRKDPSLYPGRFYVAGCKIWPSYRGPRVRPSLTIWYGLDSKSVRFNWNSVDKGLDF
jgi:hypothetical protein